MTDSKRPLKVFLCHAHADRDTVRGLYTRLTKDGVDAWLDKEKLLPGQDWELEIRKAVRESDVVVVCLSKQFNQAGFRQKEVRLALDTAMEQPEGEIFIIPARLEECDNLESLRKWHWVDLFENDGYEMLMRAFRARAKRIGATLQLKRSWLPRITSPITKSQKPVDEPKIEPSKGASEIPDEPSSDNFPDGWEDEWQRGFDSALSNVEDKTEKQEEKIIEDTKPKPIVKKIQSKKTKPSRKPNTAVVVAIIGGVATIIAGLLSSPLIERWFSPAPVVTEAVTATFTLTSRPAVPSQTLETVQVNKTPTITNLPTESFTPTLTPLPTEITDAKGVLMELVSGDDVVSFYMDKYEVTNELYKVCVESGNCINPTVTLYYLNQDKYLNHPVIYVTQDMARSYCDWRDARLPTYKEWEIASVGFPWDNLHDCDYANYANIMISSVYPGEFLYCIGATVPVGSYELGKSEFNIYDLIGNVAEWSYEDNNILGGSWSSYNWIRPSRPIISPDENNNPMATSTVGFRCITDAQQ